MLYLCLPLTTLVCLQLPDIKKTAAVECVLYTNMVTHTSKEAHRKMHFIPSADMHILAERSFEPAAEIQVALDGFAMVFISICLFSTSFFLFRGLFTASSIFLTTPHLFFLPLSSHFLSLFSMSEESDRGV